MTDLSPEATALIRAGRTAFRPDQTDRDRVLRSLSAVLGETTLSDGARRGSRPPPGASHLALPSSIIGGLAAVALVTGLVLAPRPWTRTTTHAAPAPHPPAAPAVEAVASPNPSSGEATSVTEPPPAARGAGLRPGSRGATRSPSDSLPEEVRLLFRAEQQMNDGRAAEALKTLAEHERRFPSGALAEERMAARAQVLCALGRTADAESELARLTRLYPRSPHLEHAQAVCGIDRH